MGNGKRRGRNKANGFHVVEEDTSSGSDSEYSDETESLCSKNSSGEVDHAAQELEFETKLLAAIDGLTEKSAQVRTNSFEHIRSAFVQKYVPHLILDKYLGIVDAIRLSLRKGKQLEQIRAANVASLLCIQLAEEQHSSEEVAQHLKPVLSTIINDKSVSPLARAQCCSALGLITFLADEMDDLNELMQQFQTLFSGSYLKGDGTVHQISADEASLHAAALNTWTLLLTFVSSEHICSAVENENYKNIPSFSHFMELLESPHLEVRLSAGEALALIFELGRESDDQFADDVIDDIVEILKTLAKDSNKHRAKRDKKVQRATFRDILNYIENDNISSLQIRFGKEVLILDTWTRKKQYYGLCTILGPSINMYLAENEFVRQIFKLGSRIVVSPSANLKQSKLHRHLMNAANFKARTLSIKKNRDKRSDF